MCVVAGWKEGELLVGTKVSCSSCEVGGVTLRLAKSS